MEENSNIKQLQTEAENTWYRKAALLGDSFFVVIKKKKNHDEVFVSETVNKIIGWNEQQLVEQKGKIFSLIHRDDAVQVVKQNNEFLFSKNNTAEFHYRILFQEKTEKWIHESVLVERNKTGSVTSSFSLFTDVTKFYEQITELKKTESDLRDTCEGKDKFINILSHDLRAPFTSILGFAEILINEPDLAIKDKNEYLNYILEASQNQLEFINYLLDWSRLRTGSLKIEPQRLKITGLLYNCVSTLTGNAMRKGIDIKVSAPDNLFVQADERLLKQVILNLLTNAIKFSFENSSIEISAEQFNEKQVEFVIRDSGVGLTSEEQQKIFSIESSFSNLGTKGETGTGLGLALVREIIEKHDGEIWLYSEEGKGTEFHFTLPLPSNRILIIDRDKTTIRQIDTTLENNFDEFEILHAENGYEALNIISNKIPTLVLANHQMPLMTGLQFIESTKKENGSMQFPIIIMLQVSELEQRQAYIVQGVKHFIHLPLQEEELLYTLKSTLN
ncbi:MAG: ATP-binding protein [Ignavibacteriaceae bacterium]|nr:ATP-binding protein [Ignavibacteriaceae bacterium]